MAQTTLNTQQFNGVQRDDLDVTTSTKAVIAKVIQGSGVSISSTGVDSGTGDVTVNLDINGLTEDASPIITDDFVATYDASGAVNKKVRLSNIGGNGTGPGSYNPTLTGTANVASSTTGTFRYIVSSGLVEFAGTIVVTPTAAGNTTTTIELSLPVASNFLSSDAAAGVAACDVINQFRTGIIQGSVTNDRLVLNFSSATTSGINITIVGNYRLG
jgi:hypothetical protein